MLQDSLASQCLLSCEIFEKVIFFFDKKPIIVPLTHVFSRNLKYIEKKYGIRVCRHATNWIIGQLAVFL